ncbi:hypothetical protein Tco_0381242 [Tanacetum coccineum]
MSSICWSYPLSLTKFLMFEVYDLRSSRVSTVKGFLSSSIVQSGLSKVFWAEDTTMSTYLVNRSPSSAIGFKKPLDILEFFGWLANDVTSKVVLYRNLSFNESGEYKKTFIGSGVVASVDRYIAISFLSVHNTVACEVIFKRETGLKDDMDARSDVYVLSNGCKKCSDDSDGYYWGYTPGMFIHLFLYIDDVVFSCVCKAEIWVTKGLLVKAKGTVLGLEIIRDQNGNTLRVSQSRIHNEKLVQTLLKGHSTLSLEDSLSMDHDVEKNGKRSYIYAVGSQEYQMVCTKPDIASADVDMLDRFDRGLPTNVQVFVDFDYAMGRSITVMSRSITRYGLMILGCAGSLKANLQHMEALPTTEAGYMMFTEAWKKEIWLKGLLTESGYELNLVADIATGALVKGGSRSEVPAQVEVAAYRY